LSRAAAVSADYDRNIFFNCPFDRAYRPIFNALVFAAFDCGLTPRSALEVDDAGEVRIEKILAIVRDCRLAVHDISRTEASGPRRLPRFHMPFELGLFIGARRFGQGAQNRKVCLVLDREPYRFQAFLSDIAGQDIRAHRADPEEAISQFRAWLSPLSSGPMLPGGRAIGRRYKGFQEALPKLLASARLRRSEMTFPDYTNAVSIWLQAQRRRAAAL